MLPSLNPISSQRREKLSDHVYDALCEHIIEGQLKPGQRLREAVVANALGVSRTPVREAFARLERQRLLYQDTNGAYYIAEWDKKALWELATLRGALEGLAARLACERLKLENYDHLEMIIVQMQTALQRDDTERLVALDTQFHSYIWSNCGHELLILALEEMKAQILYYMYITRPTDELDYPNAHRQLLAALKSGNPDEAVEAIQAHILDTAERTIARLPQVTNE